MNAFSPGRPRIRVAAVYAPSPHNREWLRLQADRLLDEGPCEVEFGVYCNGVALDLPAGVHCIGQSPDNLGHGPALRELLAHFRGPWRGADGYLVLDSDCFPVRADWQPVLTGLMRRHGKTFAAPVRYENLEDYPHPCALYIDAGALDDPRLVFDEAAGARNLAGLAVRDVGAGLASLSDDLLPLVRSNVVNRHPVAAALYNHLFYHHGAGSRGFGFRAINRCGYYDHWHQPDAAAEARLAGDLFADPDAFIAVLAGKA